MKPPVPLNEHARLELLRQYDILDTEPDILYDEITTRATQVLGMPISLLTFVDKDRVWFKSASGLEMSETPRETSFCAHAVCQDDVYMVPDAKSDERFQDNPLVTGETKARFYAGVPLLSPEGLALGTLCVIDRKTRKLTAEQTAKLKQLGKEAVLLLEVRRAGGRTLA